MARVIATRTIVAPAIACGELDRAAPRPDGERRFVLAAGSFRLRS